MQTIYETPPTTATAAQQRCQLQIGKGLRLNWLGRFHSRQICQYAADQSVSAADCGKDETTSWLGRGRQQLDAAVAKCGATDLAALNTCASSVEGEQQCARAAAETASDVLSNAIFTRPANEDAPFTGQPCPPNTDVFEDCWPTSGMSLGVPAFELSPGDRSLRFAGDAYCSAGYLQSGDDRLPDVVCSGREGLRVYRNKGRFQFEEVTAEVGLAAFRSSGFGANLALGDLDGDGEQDLVGAEIPQSVLPILRDAFLNGVPLPKSFDVKIHVFRNQGGVFHEVTEQWGFGAKPYPSFPRQSLKLADVNHDGKLDVALTLTSLVEPFSPLLFVSQPDGTWKDMAVELFGSDVTGNPYAVAWTDVDQDGEADFVLANNASGGGAAPSSFLLRKQGLGYVREMIGPLLSQASAMGVSAIDLDNDGWMELLFTDIRISHLLKRGSDGTWSDLAASVGLADLLNLDGDESSGQFVGFAPAFIPVLGKLGVFISAGTDGGNVGKPYMKMFTFENNRFTERSDLIQQFAQHNGEGMAQADFDGDGCPDLLVAGHAWLEPLHSNWIEDPPLLIWNRSSPGQCLGLGFRTTKGNSYALGTLVTVESGGTTRTQALYGLGSEDGDDEPRVFFPVAAAEAAHVSIRWPDGSSQHVDLMPGRYTLHQP